MREEKVSKVLGMTDVSEQYSKLIICVEKLLYYWAIGHEHLIQLDVLPVFAPAPGLDTHVHRLHLTLPSLPSSHSSSSRIPTPASHPSSHQNNSPALQHSIRKRWLAAFHQSHTHTIRSLSYPHEEKLNQPQQQDFLDSLEVIRSTGLPMPKSPSQQLLGDPIAQAQGQGQNTSQLHTPFLGNSGGGGEGGRRRRRSRSQVRNKMKEEEIEGEREERGFWSLRFQLVMKERRRVYSVWANGEPPFNVLEGVDEVKGIKLSGAGGDEFRQRRISMGSGESITCISSFP